MAMPLTDIAFNLLNEKKKEIPFINLWQEVSQIRGFTQAQADDKIAQFYADLTLDSRFVNLKDNSWDLRSRHKFEDVVIKTDAILVDDEDEEEEIIEEIVESEVE